ncbi:MAG: hypothetical protein WCY82_07055 [Desulfotomaculaceae bacterium]
MLIQTIKRDFAVLRMLESTRDLDIAVCRDLLEQQDRVYLVLTLKNPDLIYKTLPFFTKLKQNASFSDFRECFAQDGQFFLVFSYYDKPLLVEKYSAGSYALVERLEIGRSLLSRMVLLDMPPSLQYDALQERNLVLDDALQVWFNYRLEEISSYPSLTGARVQAELARIFRMLLGKEIATEVAPELLLFINNLVHGSFKDYLDVYKAYDEVYTLLMSLEEKGEIEPKSLLFRLWERAKALAGYVRPVLATVVLVTALGYLFFTFMHPPNTAGTGASQIIIEKIGTVDIK